MYPTKLVQVILAYNTEEAELTSILHLHCAKHYKEVNSVHIARVRIIQTPVHRAQWLVYLNIP